MNRYCAVFTVSAIGCGWATLPDLEEGSEA